MENEKQRYLFRLYNIPIDLQKIKTLLDNLSLSYKNIWIATPSNGYDDLQLTWSWIEFHTKDDLDTAKLCLDGMKWHNNILRVC